MTDKTHNGKEHNLALDAAKFVASVLVMLIHTPLFSKTGSLIWQFDALARMAVPFFAICSGYLLAGKITFSDRKILKTKENNRQFRNCLHKNGRTYFIWALVYLIVSIPRWAQTGWFSSMVFVDWGISLFTNGSYFHLWYYLYLLYAVAGIYLISKVIPVDRYPLLAGVLFGIEVVQYAYRGLLPQTVSAGFRLFDVYPCLSAFTRILPLLMLGIYISYRRVEKEKSGAHAVGFAVSFTLLVIERNFLISTGQKAVSYITWTLPAAYFLFRIILNTRGDFSWGGWRVLGGMSKYIYPLHPLLMEITNAAPILPMTVRICIWLTLSLVCSYFAVRMENRVLICRRKRVKR